MTTTDLLKPAPAHADNPAKRMQWWIRLTPEWRAAFSMAHFGHANHPTDDELTGLWQTPVLRFAGPKAMFPNLSFELTDCSGLTGLTNLEILVLMNHRIQSIGELATLPNLKSLFVNNNALRSLDGVEALPKLEQLYAHSNQLTSLSPLKTLTNLKEVYVNVNALTSLDGLTRQHARSLKKFFCLPNDDLPDREIIRVEQKLGIRCRAV